MCKFKITQKRVKRKDKLPYNFFEQERNLSMNNFKLLNQDFIKNFSKSINSIDDFMKLMLEQYKNDIQHILNELLKDGLTEFLKYEKYKRADTDNYRNGYYTRKLLLEIGEIELNIPRDRNGDFNNKLIKNIKEHKKKWQN
ncbi:transposase [Mycoplasma aquilae ATCC BAA-1896]|uniref:transposase n=1 Tax=Mycoplasma aquilae TaxID=1312741 RepID=UPI003A861825